MSKNRIIDNKEYVRVTHVISQTIAKPALYYFYAREAVKCSIIAVNKGLSDADVMKLSVQAPGKISRAAAKRGTEVHKAVDNVNSGKPLDGERNWLMEEAKPFFDGFEASRSIWETKRLTKIENRLVRSEQYRFSGEIDDVCDLINKSTGEVHKNVLIDYKTGKGMYYTHGVQLGAYALGLYEMGVTKVDEGVVFLMMPDGSFELEFYSRDQLKQKAKVFLACLEIYKDQFGDWTKE